MDPELPACGHILKMVKWCMEKAPDGSEKGFNIRGYQNHYIRSFLTAAGVNTRQDNVFQAAFGTLGFDYLKNSDSYRISWKVDNASSGVFGAAVDAGMTGPGAYETGVHADEAIPLGTTKTENGVTYILGLSHRWERFDGDLGADIDSVAFKNNWDAWLEANDEMVNEHCQKALEKGNNLFAAFLARVLADRKTKGDTDAAQESPVGNPALDNALKDAPEVVQVRDGDGQTHYVQKTDVIATITQGSGGAVERVIELAEKNPEKTGEALEFLAEGMVKRGLIDGVNESEKQAEELVQIENPKNLSSVTRNIQTKIADGDYRDYGSWSANGRNLGAVSRKSLNEDVSSILLKPRDEMTPDDVDKIRRYSGFGGVDIEGERGVLYDYYTSPPAAKMLWQLMNKVSTVDNGSNVLEPSCGTGVFFEVAPDGVNLTGVEYDKRTAAAADVLQGHKAKINVGSFEQFNLHNDQKFTHVIGNCPFGDRSIVTSFMDQPEEKSLDRYFMSRSMDNLADGGTMAMIANAGPLNNKDSKEWRLSMLKKGQFMGAYQLPNKSFKHTQTGVEPVVYLFKKYPEEVRKRLELSSEEVMRKSGFVDDDFLSGKYFDKHPEARIGQWDEHGGKYGQGELNGDLDAAKMDDLVFRFNPKPMSASTWSELKELVNLPIEKEKNPDALLKLTADEAEAVASKMLFVGMTKTVNGRVYRLNENHRWELMEGLTEEGVKKLNIAQEIAKKVKAIRSGMLGGEPVDRLQSETRELYAEFEKRYGNAPKDDRELKAFIRNNYRIAGIQEALAAGIDADILTKNSIYDKDIDLKDGFKPEIKALLDLQHKMLPGTDEVLKQFYPNDYDSIIDAMFRNQDVFVDSSGTWTLREDFCAGNAWEKIDELSDAIKAEPDSQFVGKWAAGIDALKDAVGWVNIEDAGILPTASWIPEEVIQEWVEDSFSGGKVYKDKETGKWENDGSWDAKRVSYYLNGYKQKEKGVDTEEFNADTELNFMSWLSTYEKRNEIEEMYNRKFNTEISAPTKTYSVDIDGWNPEISLKPHQWQTIHHLYRAGKGISALGVGFGKTTSAIGLMALLRQEGKAKRFFLQVPNNKVEDWVAEISGRDNPDPRLCVKARMPGLKVGYINPSVKDKKPEERYRAYQELANGDYDVIVMPESCASEIQLNAENDAVVIDRYKGKQGSVESKNKSKREEAKEEIALENVMSSKKKNLTISFEDFGCDAIICDEAHNYKNLFSSSTAREIGMADGRNSARAMSFLKKCDFIRQKNDGKNVFLLTATPLTNSPLEYYNMMQHVAPERLDELNIENIDDFINNFASVSEMDIYNWATGKLEKRNQVTGFKQLRTLQDIFFKYTDLQNDPKAIKIEKPDATNKPNLLDQNDEVTLALKNIAKEYEEWKEQMLANKKAGISRAESGDNRTDLTFWQQMRTASLDLELMDPKEYHGWKNPKLEALANNAIEIQKNRGGGQVIFCDRVMSGKGDLNMHEKIKSSLVAKGVDPADIIMVNGITKSGGKMSESELEKTVSAAVDGFNTGKYKYIIGTTQTLGEGVNLQKNSSALHHVDIPFRPSDFIQRNGRVDRQGNAQGSVELHTYLGKGTLDAGSVAMVQRKANWIDTMLKTKSDVFANPDAEGGQVDMDEIMASLQEEWGDTKSAEERRKLIKDKKEAAEKAEKLKMATDGLKQLSIIRGALRTSTDKPGSAEMQARLRKMHTLAQSLAANSEFKHPDLLTDAAPDFIYDHKSGVVYREGDHFLDKDGRYFRIEGINHKKQSFTTNWVGGKTQREEYRSGPRGYPGKAIKIQPSWSMKYGVSLPDGSRHIPGGIPQREIDDTTIAFDKEKYSKLPLEEKARLWDKHKKSRVSDYGKGIYEDGPSGNLTSSSQDYNVRDEEGGYLKREPLNPFNKADRDKILSKYKEGKVSKYENGSIRSAYEDIDPELKNQLEQIEEENKTQKALKNQGPRLRLIMRQGV